jgi:hypothetical protein
MTGNCLAKQRSFQIIARIAVYNVFLQMATAGQVDRINLDDTLSLPLPGVDMGQEAPEARRSHVLTFAPLSHGLPLFPACYPAPSLIGTLVPRPGRFAPLPNSQSCLAPSVKPTASSIRRSSSFQACFASLSPANNNVTQQFSFFIPGLYVPAHSVSRPLSPA